MARPSDTHPDLADLDAARTGEAPAEVDDHLRACAECRAIVADLTGFARVLGGGDTLTVPEAIDGRILWAARKHAAGARRNRSWAPLVLRRGLAVAASILLALGLVRAWTRPTAPGADVDRNGVVDIRDAFLIARTLRTDRPGPRDFDLNGDHVVDERDVDVAARAAVSLARTL